MVNTTAIRNKLANKIFNISKGVASTITIIPLTLTQDEYGEDVETEGDEVTVYAVPFNYKSYTKTMSKWGELDVGSVDLLVPYDTDIGRNYKVNYNSTDYRVQDVEQYVVKDATLAIAVRLAEEL